MPTTVAGRDGSELARAEHNGGPGRMRCVRAGPRSLRVRTSSTNETHTKFLSTASASTTGLSLCTLSSALSRLALLSARTTILNQSSASVLPFFPSRASLLPCGLCLARHHNEQRRNICSMHCAHVAVRSFPLIPSCLALTQLQDSVDSISSSVPSLPFNSLPFCCHSFVTRLRNPASERMIVAPSRYPISFLISLADR